MTVEMGSLHYPPEVTSPNAPGISSDILEFKVSGDCNVTISANTARGGVVLYSAVEASTNLDTSCSVMGEDCLVVGQVIGGVLITQDMFNLWVAKGKPCEWCYECHYRGDINGDCIIDSTDLLGTGDGSDGWSYAWNTDWNAGSDTNNDGIIDSTDLLGSGSDGWSVGWNTGCGTCDPTPPTGCN
jgi:hypothetical protein